MPKLRATAAAAVAAALAMTLAGCDSDTGQPDSKPSASATQAISQQDIDDLKDALGDIDPKDLPDSLKDLDLDKWRNGAWKNWDKDDWLREAKEFINPIIKDFWNDKRLHDAEGHGKEVDESDVDEGVTDPVPAPVTAKKVPTPYDDAPPVGKILFETPEGPAVCSGTVVKDPKHPGTSNLVATAGHCVHAGAEGGWYRNIVFVPHFNSKGLSLEQIKGTTLEEHAPQGVWWAKQARTTPYWIDNGGPNAHGAARDFAVLKVRPENPGKYTKSLEETVGQAVDIDFGTPAVDDITSLTAIGYPAAPPFDGMAMYECTDEPGRLTIRDSRPTMYRIGCTMTGGSSGGGWLDADGDLLSVTSIGPVDRHTWLAGARLDKEAKAVYQEIVATK